MTDASRLHHTWAGTLNWRLDGVKGGKEKQEAFAPLMLITMLQPLFSPHIGSKAIPAQAASTVLAIGTALGFNGTLRTGRDRLGRVHRCVPHLGLAVDDLIGMYECVLALTRSAIVDVAFHAVVRSLSGLEACTLNQQEVSNGPNASHARLLDNRRKPSQGPD